MDSSVTVLISATLLVLLAPLLGACLFLLKGNSRVNLITSQWRKARLWCAREQIKVHNELESKYQLLQDVIVSCRQATVESIGIENNLRKQLDKSLQRVQQWESRAAMQPDNEWLAQRPLRLREKITHLQNELQLQESKSASLREKLTTLESEMQQVYTQRQVYIAKLSYDSAVVNANKILSKTCSGEANNVFEKMELKVLKRETAAAQLQAFQDLPPFQEMSESEKRAEEVFSKALGIVENFHSLLISVRSAAGKATIAADPSVERAYQRLNKSLQSARQLADQSAQEEGWMEKQIASTSKQAEWSKEFADESAREGNQLLEEDARLRQTHNEAAAHELASALKTHKIKNLSIQQTLYRVEAVARRLYVIKLLLFALPGSKKTELWQFTKLADALCEYLKASFAKTGEPTDKETPTNFSQRIAELEQSTLMAYIRIAKGQSNELSGRASKRFNRDLTTISTVLDLERSDAKAEYDKWNNLANQAFEEEKELLHAVAKQRSEYCAQSLKMMEQSLDVLTVTISLMEQRSKRNKAS